MANFKIIWPKSNGAWAFAFLLWAVGILFGPMVLSLVFPFWFDESVGHLIVAVGLALVLLFVSFVLTIRHLWRRWTGAGDPMTTLDLEGKREK